MSRYVIRLGTDGRIPNNQAPYECGECGQPFQSWQALWAHVRWARGDRP